MLGRITDGSDYPESYWFSFTGSVRPWEILLPLEATRTKSYTSVKTLCATWALITDAPHNGQVNVWENNGCFTADEWFQIPCWNKNILNQPKLVCQSQLFIRACLVCWFYKGLLRLRFQLDQQTLDWFKCIIKKILTYSMICVSNIFRIFWTI